MVKAMEKLFNTLISDRLKNKAQNNQLFTIDHYNSLLTNVKKAKNKTRNKTPQDYQRLARYDVINTGDVERLITPVKKEGDPVIFYVHVDEIFKIIHDCHISIGHGGRSKMMKELKLKYKNITAEAVTLYLKLCNTCQKKRNPPNVSFQKQIIRDELNLECQVDLIDMESHPDGKYKFIMVYRDLQTKFIQLRPLKSKEATEIAEYLLDIFTIFGAHNILHNSNNRKLTSKVVREIGAKWRDVKMVHDETHSQSQHIEEEEKHIKQMLCTWLESNKTTKWSDGLRFIQFIKNNIFLAEINRSPYEAMFGCKAKVGLKSFLPQESLTGISTEEELNDMTFCNDNESRDEEEEENETDIDLHVEVKADPEVLLSQNENQVIQSKELIKPDILEIEIKVEEQELLPNSYVDQVTKTLDNISNIKEEENDRDIAVSTQNKNGNYHETKIKMEFTEIEVNLTAMDPLKCNQNEQEAVGTYCTE